MFTVLSTDPLTLDLRTLTAISLPTPNGPGHGSASQQGHVADCNSDDGIRGIAATAGYLTAEENQTLKLVLEHWPWLDLNDRKTTNRVITMLFTIRKRFGLADPDRTRLSECLDFRRKPKKQSAPRQRWRKTAARQSRERGSFSSI